MEPSPVWARFLELAPRSLTVFDYEGKKRTFRLGGTERDLFGYDLHAIEEKEGDGRYEFRAFSHASPQEALTRLTEKVRSALATRCLEPSLPDGVPSLLAHAASGRVVSGGVVIDGKVIYWPEFIKMAAAYEGWEFTIQFGER